MQDKCAPQKWLLHTRNNTSSNRVVVVDSWAHIGMGHTIQASASWLHVVLQTNRSIRFAFCVPRRVTAAFQEHGNVMPHCSKKSFDLHEYAGFAGLDNLEANPKDFSSISNSSTKQCRILFDV